MFTRLIGMGLILGLTQPLAASLITNTTLDDLALYSAQDVTIGWNARIDGSAAASGAIGLGDQARVDGNLYAGGAAAIGWHSQYDGLYEHLGASHFDGLGLPNVGFSPVGGDLLRIGNKDKLTLAPGTYGGLVADWKSELKLRAGSYYFDSLDFADDTRITLDTSLGDVFVHVAGNADFDWKSRISRSGDGGALFLVGGSFDLADQSDFDASIVAHGPATIGWKADVAGQVFSRDDINIGSQASVGGESLVQVPEPASVAVLMLGAIVLIRRR